MTAADKPILASFAAVNDKSKPRAWTWTAIIKAMRTVDPSAERAAWMASKLGWTASQFLDRMTEAPWDGHTAATVKLRTMVRTALVKAAIYRIDPTMGGIVPFMERDGAAGRLEA